MPVSLTTEAGFANNINVGNPLNDCFGFLTQVAGTPIVRVIPPSNDQRACLGNFNYMPAATAHVLTAMLAMSETVVTSEVAAAGTVIPIGNLLTAFDASPVNNNDYIVVQYEDGTWVAMLVSSVSGLNLTVPATAQKILKGSKIFLMGVPADHPNRQFQTIASTMYSFIAGDFRIRAATGSKKGSPILFHSPNTTNAGTLHYLAFYYD